MQKSRDLAQSSLNDDTPNKTKLAKLTFSRTQSMAPSLEVRPRFDASKVIDLDAQFIAKLDELIATCAKNWTEEASEPNEFIKTLEENNANDIHILFAKIIFCYPLSHLCKQEFNANTDYMRIANILKNLIQAIANKIQLANFVKKYALDRLSNLEKIFIFLNSLNNDPYNNIQQYLAILNTYVLYDHRNGCLPAALPNFSSPMELQIFAKAIIGLIPLATDYEQLRPMLVQVYAKLEQYKEKDNTFVDVYMQAKKILDLPCKSSHNYNPSMQLPMYNRLRQTFYNNRVPLGVAMLSLPSLYLAYNMSANL
jgi:hypothetical protein